ncbi:hypothetical protein Poli38472_010328 [Pythium oligandrum]|uniref:EF-hand domain-containing protein n=1 Tax=Pythium oligandrum TaxID=41045 RepID=A0A8K1C2U7_PYTOL|nr:hypothetical protein Poli38472_010328 [Pythium oligandrum]|eukprot:TMW55446.1 hypothetical protein Poli38472_010328 [Pythium oligandrum]
MSGEEAVDVTGHGPLRLDAHQDTSVPNYGSTSTPSPRVVLRIGTVDVDQLRASIGDDMDATRVTDVARRNPFRYNSPVGTYETVKIVVMCCLGVPLIRLALILVLLVALALVAFVATIGYTAVDPVSHMRRPMSHWRRMLTAPIPLLIRAILFVLGYYWIPVKHPKKGLETKKMNPRIIVSNHIAFIDGPFFAYFLSPSIAMKAELGKIPILGRIIATMQPILIDRNTSDGRKRALDDINDHINTSIFPPLLIFPEGTTSNQDYLTKFKVGSFASGLPCQPVVIKYPFKHFDVSWTPDVSGLYLLGRMLCQVYNQMEVEFLPPYIPDDHERAHPEVYAENVRQVMSKALGVDCTNHAFEDVALLLHVGTYADQHVVPITDVSEVITLTALRSGDIKKLVQYFMKHDLNRDGQISLEELTQLFPSDNPELLERLFHLIDLDGSGFIDFRELCMGLAALNPNRDVETLINFDFQLYDVDGNGVIDKHEVDRMLTFFQSFYGQAEQGQIDQTQLVDPQGLVTFDRFRDFMLTNPSLLGHAKSKLEILRGSLRED